MVMAAGVFMAYAIKLLCAGALVCAITLRQNCAQTLNIINNTSTLTVPKYILIHQIN